MARHHLQPPQILGRCGARRHSPSQPQYDPYKRTASPYQTPAPRSTASQSYSIRYFSNTTITATVPLIRPNALMRMIHHFPQQNRSSGLCPAEPKSPALLMPWRMEWSPSAVDGHRPISTIVACLWLPSCSTAILTAIPVLLVNQRLRRRRLTLISESQVVLVIWP